MAKHDRVFNYAYGVSKVISVDVCDLDVEIVVAGRDGELIITRMDHAGFFERKPIPGMWMVDGFQGERFFVDDSGLKRLGEEDLDQEG